MLLQNGSKYRSILTNFIKMDLSLDLFFEKKNMYIFLDQFCQEGDGKVFILQINNPNLEIFMNSLPIKSNQILVCLLFVVDFQSSLAIKLLSINICFLVCRSRCSVINSIKMNIFDLLKKNPSKQALSWTSWRLCKKMMKKL